MRKSYIADNILREYQKEKRYKENKERAELQAFFKNNCTDCKNKKTKLCHIVKNINGDFQCAFKE